MTGTAVNWGLGAALAMVASVAAWRLARPSGRRSSANKRADPLLHLAMALGMTSMLAPVGGSKTAVVATGFGIAAVGLLARSRAHHAVMSGIMALMMLRGRMTTGPASAGAATMPMPSSGHGVSLLLLAAFGYAAVSACVFTWRMPASVSYGARTGLHTCAIDPLGRGCEIVMLVSTAVMLLPMI